MPARSQTAVREPEPPSWIDEAPDDGEPPGARVAVLPLRPVPTPLLELPALHRTPLGDVWAGLVARLEQGQRVAALARELALQSELIEQQDGPSPLWRLRVERESLRAAPLRDKLTAALADELGLPAQIGRASCRERVCSTV